MKNKDKIKLIYDPAKLSKEEEKQLVEYIAHFENKELGAIQLIQYWSSLPAENSSGRFPEINEYLKNK